MQTTISNIRRGDRFTWNNTEWIAIYDAAPSSADPAATNDPGFSAVYMAKASKFKARKDGVLEVIGTTTETILSDKEVTVHDRGLRVHCPADDVRPEVPAWQARNGLERVVRARVAAQRQLEDTDEEFRNFVRQSIASNVSIPEICEVTGLSRQRIYQIRDGRR